MGNAAYRQTSAGSVAYEQDLRLYIQNDLPRFMLQSKIGNGKFMKTFVMRANNSQVVVKVYQRLQDEDLQIAARLLTSLWSTIPPTKYPNLQPYQLWLKSTARVKVAQSLVYLVRQYFNSNLYDRLSTRPFLRELEKLWLIYQLLKCLEICHEHGIVHGDVKPENIMCTTTNWMVLTDFSPYKPAFIPDDDLTDFQYYFDTMSRDRCYIAPERFFRKAVGMSTSNANTPPPKGVFTKATSRASTFMISSDSSSNKGGSAKGVSLLPTVDIFSAGCVMAEIMLDGSPLFDLPSMLQYISATGESLGGPLVPAGHPLGKRTTSKIPSDTNNIPSTTVDNNTEDISPLGAGVTGGLGEEFLPKQQLARLKNPAMRAIIVDMTRKDGTRRLTATDYLRLLQQPPTDTPSSTTSILPPYFENCIYPLYLKLHWQGCTPDDRITIICENYGEMIRRICNFDDNNGTDFFSKARDNAELVTTALFNNGNMIRDKDLLLPAVGHEIKKHANDNMKLPTIAKERLAKMQKCFLWSSAENARVVNQEEMLRKMNLNELIETAKQRIDTLKTTHFQPTAPASDGKTDSVAAQQKVDFASVIAMLSDLESRKETFLETHDATAQRTSCEGLVLITDILCASYRHLKLLPSRILTLLLLGRMGRLVPDQVILQRLIPVVLLAVEDNGFVALKVLGLRILTTLLSTVERIEPIEVNYFSQYVFHILSRVAKDQELLVRITFAKCLGRLGLIAKRFLVMGHQMAMQRAAFDSINGCGGGGGAPPGSTNATATTATASNGGNNTPDPNVTNLPPASAAAAPQQPGQGAATGVSDFPFDVKLEALKEQIARWIRDLITDNTGGMGSISTMLMSTIDTASTAPTAGSGKNGSAAVAANANTRLRNMKISSFIAPEAAVKKVLIQHIGELCQFYGQESTMDKLLTQLLTFLNDADWELRCAFCHQIPRVAAFLGLTVSTEYILPCLENSIYDVEEKVSVAAIAAITSLVKARLVSRYWIVDFMKRAVALLLHPLTSLRLAAVDLIVTSAGVLGELDTIVFLFPALLSVSKLTQEGKLIWPVTHEMIRAVTLPPVSRDGLRKLLTKELDVLSAEFGLLGNSTAAAPTAVAGSMIVASATVTAAGAASKSNDSLGSISSEYVTSMSPYLTATAKEIYTKTLRWRSAISNNTANGPVANGISNEVMQLIEQGRGSIARLVLGRYMEAYPSLMLLANSNRKSIRSYDHLLLPLQWYSTSSFELSAQALQVPTMRGAVGIPEDFRRQAIYLDHQDDDKNLFRIRALFLGLGGGSSAQREELNQQMQQLLLHSGSSLADTPGTASSITPNLNQQLAAASQPMQSPFAISSSSRTSSNYGDAIALLRRLRALQVPPAPVDLGALLGAYNDITADGRPITATNTGSNIAVGGVNNNSIGGGGALDDDRQGSAGWGRGNNRDREGVCILTLREHSAAVNRLVVPQDQAYFCSASSDGNVKVWTVKQLDKVAFPRSAGSYQGHNGPVLDACAIEGSHSVASCGRDGTVHVWRVDLQSSSPLQAGQGQQDTSSSVDAQQLQLQNQMLTVKGASVIRALNPHEGQVLGVQHYNADVCSVVLFATQRGGIHGWDLRAPKEAFHFSARPELGYISSIAVGPDRSWIAAGTSHSAVALWDIRYNTLAAAWRHSSGNIIHRLASCRIPRASANAAPESMLLGGSGSGSGGGGSAGCYLFAAAGQNEAAVFALPDGGEALKCFRVLPLNDSKLPVSPLPALLPLPLPRHPSAVIAMPPPQSSTTTASVGHSVRAMIGRVSPTNGSYLITAGTDRAIRFWDFRGPEHSWCVSPAVESGGGVLGVSNRGLFRGVKADDIPADRLVVCYTPAAPAAEKVQQAQLPLREGRGPCTVQTMFRDAVLDLKDLDTSAFGGCRFLLSSSKDGEIKVWR